MLTPKEKREFDLWLNEKYTETQSNKEFIFEEIKNYTDDYSKFIVTKFLESAFESGMNVVEKRHRHGTVIDNE